MRAAVAILLVGCGAHGGGEAPLIAFAPSDVPAADTSTSSDARVLYAHFRTTAKRADVRGASCSLRPSIQIEGRSIRVAVRAFGAPCEDAPADSVPMTVDEREDTIVLEIEVPERLTGADVEHFRDGFQDIGRELTRRVRSMEASSLPRRDPRPQSEKVMLTSAAMWAVTLATGAIGATILGAGAASGDLIVEATGGAALFFITAPLFLGAVTTSIVAGALYSAEP